MKIWILDRINPDHSGGIALPLVKFYVEKLLEQRISLIVYSGEWSEPCQILVTESAYLRLSEVCVLPSAAIVSKVLLKFRHTTCSTFTRTTLIMPPPLIGGDIKR